MRIARSSKSSACYYFFVISFLYACVGLASVRADLANLETLVYSILWEHGIYQHTIANATQGINTKMGDIKSAINNLYYSLGNNQRDLYLADLVSNTQCINNIRTSVDNIEGYTLACRSLLEQIKSSVGNCDELEGFSAKFDNIDSRIQTINLELIGSKGWRENVSLGIDDLLSVVNNLALYVGDISSVVEGIDGVVSSELSGWSEWREGISETFVDAANYLGYIGDDLGSIYCEWGEFLDKLDRIGDNTDELELLGGISELLSGLDSRFEGFDASEFVGWSQWRSSIDANLSSIHSLLSDFQTDFAPVISATPEYRESILGYLSEIAPTLSSELSGWSEWREGISETFVDAANYLGWIGDDLGSIYCEWGEFLDKLDRIGDNTDELELLGGISELLAGIADADSDGNEDVTDRLDEILSEFESGDVSDVEIEEYEDPEGLSEYVESYVSAHKEVTDDDSIESVFQDAEDAGTKLYDYFSSEGGNYYDPKLNTFRDKIKTFLPFATAAESVSWVVDVPVVGGYGGGSVSLVDLDASVIQSQSWLRGVSAFVYSFLGVFFSVKILVRSK